MTTQSTTPAGFTGNRNRYYNPVSKIQSLIHNLDAELVQLCKQCSVQKPLASHNTNTALGSHFASTFGALGGGSSSLGGGSSNPYRPESIGSLLARARVANPTTRSTMTTSRFFNYLLLKLDIFLFKESYIFVLYSF